jgi:hypothetical protein
MREKSATDLHELVLDCPACGGRGWMTAAAIHPSWVEAGVVTKVDELTIVCPVCFGHSWVPAVATEGGAQ